jgi:hypothetical protein
LILSGNQNQIWPIEYRKIMDTIYPAEMDTLGILYTDKKPFGFLIFRLAG